MKPNINKNWAYYRIMGYKLQKTLSQLTKVENGWVKNESEMNEVLKQAKLILEK